MHETLRLSTRQRNRPKVSALHFIFPNDDAYGRTFGSDRQ